jgi:hypothetical protein
MKVVRVCIACLFLICLLFVFSSCKTAKKHKCKDCPTFTYVNDGNIQKNK